MSMRKWVLPPPPAKTRTFRTASSLTKLPVAMFGVVGLQLIVDALNVAASPGVTARNPLFAAASMVNVN